MSILKSKIKSLEAIVDNDIQILIQQRHLLNDKIKKIKMGFFLSEILAGGFSFGFLLASPWKGSHKKRRFASLVMFVKLRSWIKNFISFLKVPSAVATLKKNETSI